jgi:large subunit ribosomal protein L18
MTTHVRAIEIRKWARRERRGFRASRDVTGTPERPRLAVYRSHRHFHAQLIDDLAGRTIASASTEQKAVIEGLKHGGDRKAAEAVGRHLAESAKKAGVSKVVFDRHFFRFHGRVRAFAEAAAKGGLLFLVNPDKKAKAPKAPKAEKPAAKAEKQKPAKPEGGKKPEGKKPEGKKE